MHAQVIKEAKAFIDSFVLKLNCFQWGYLRPFLLIDPLDSSAWILGECQCEDIIKQELR